MSLGQGGTALLFEGVTANWAEHDGESERLSDGDFRYKASTSIHPDRLRSGLVLRRPPPAYAWQSNNLDNRLGLLCNRVCLLYEKHEEKSLTDSHLR